jgi:uncharacterized OB-fold protein
MIKKNKCSNCKNHVEYQFKRYNPTEQQKSWFNKSDPQTKWFAAKCPKCNVHTILAQFV